LHSSMTLWKSGAHINNGKLVKVLAEEAHDVFYGLEQYGLLLDRGPPPARCVRSSVRRSFVSCGLTQNGGSFHGIVGGLKRGSHKKM